jgi:hypothetical protein
MQKYLNSRLTLIILFLFVSKMNSQILQEFDLSPKLNEISGLEILAENILAHLDSNNSSTIFLLNTKGEIIKEKKIENLINNDWEDITIDKGFFYIADAGNNYDTRKNLRILKFSIKDLKFQGEIKFSYPEQTSFEFNEKSQFDSEGLISVDNKLIIFTKNRLKKNTQVYELPNYPGSFSAKKLGEIETNAIITGADFHEDSKTLALTGTKDFKNYSLLIIENFSISPISFKQIKRHPILIDPSQVEGVKIIKPNLYWVSSENEDNSSSAKLIKIKTQ